MIVHPSTQGSEAFNDTATSNILATQQETPGPLQQLLALDKKVNNVGLRVEMPEATKLAIDLVRAGNRQDILTALQKGALCGAGKLLLIRQLVAAGVENDIHALWSTLTEQCADNGMALVAQYLTHRDVPTMTAALSQISFFPSLAGQMLVTEIASRGSLTQMIDALQQCNGAFHLPLATAIAHSGTRNEILSALQYIDSTSSNGVANVLAFAIAKNGTVAQLLEVLQHSPCPFPKDTVNYLLLRIVEKTTAAQRSSLLQNENLGLTLSEMLRATVNQYQD